MKKIININLSGRVIPIEDSAYEKLQAYIESLRRYFAKEEGRDEIINDIESRIAELMNDKIRKGANAITDEDIDQIAASMGRPEDFDAEMADDDDNKKSEQQAASGSSVFDRMNSRTKRRLYRNTNDRLVGGVCSGIANYLDVDPSIVRLLFAIITFGGFGFGVLAYIILWIVLPEQGLGQYSGKRLYRNPDDRVLGGVAGGLAAYFNKDAKIIRLIFAAPILLKILIAVLSIPFWNHGSFFPDIAFGSLTGTFVLAYIILWIVLPEANTEYEKMEMRGEKIDVNRIKQNVQDKARDFSEEVKTAASEFSSRVGDFSKDKGKQFAREITQAAGTAGSGIGHAIGVIFKVFFFFIAGSIAFGLFVALLALLFSGVAWWPFNNFLWTSDWQMMLAWGTVIFFLLVPLVGFITWMVRRLMKIRSGGGYMGWTFGALWFLGWVCAIWLAASITHDFRYYEEGSKDLSISQPTTGKLTVGVSAPELNYQGGYGWMNDDRTGWDIDGDSLQLSWVNIDVTKSKDSAFHVVLWKNAWGHDMQDARTRATRISYDVNYTDSYLDLGNGISIGKENAYRGQHVVVEIQVPVGKKIRFDESITDKLNNVEIEFYDNYGRRRNWNRRGVHIRDTDFRWRTNTDYTMGEDGILFNPNMPKETNPKNRDGYRWQGTDAAEREKSIREEMRKLEEDKADEKRKLEEELRQLEEEKRQDSINKTKTAKPESMDNSNEVALGGGYLSPVFSLARFMN